MMKCAYLLAVAALISSAAWAEPSITTRETTSLDFQRSVGSDAFSLDGHTAYGFGLRRFVLCVDGLKLFQTVGPTAIAHLNGITPSVSTIQLYEERDGKVVPARCR